MQLLLLLLAFFLPPMAKAGEIIGGQKAKPHSHPYMAYLQRLDNGFWKMCGGFLIQEDFVMTAAHCSGSSINVTLGAHNIKEQEKTQEVIPVKRAIRHPDYQHLTNDIMLLQLERKVKLTPAVQLLRLPRSNSQVKPGTVCSVAGWGQMTPTGKPSDELQEVKLTVQKDQECKTHFSKYNNTSQMCVGDPKIRHGPFQGDSGGPLVCNKVAQGIVSYARNDGTAPQVFTKVSHFLKWIKNTMNHR
ncbi:granzyme B-like [Castor canadensis]|uniref:Granzyme B-like n=1 Tax=Castor canadensis TaxID=51338 RepID=A0A8C0WH68_CASCN|nr:granzyme B-like [Castor canadensis]